MSTTLNYTKDRADWRIVGCNSEAGDINLTMSALWAAQVSPPVGNREMRGSRSIWAKPCWCQRTPLVPLTVRPRHGAPTSHIRPGQIPSKERDLAFVSACWEEHTREVKTSGELSNQALIKLASKSPQRAEANRFIFKSKVEM